MSGVSIQDDLKKPSLDCLSRFHWVVLVGFYFAPSSTTYFFVLSFCPIFLCLWSLLGRLQDPSSSCCGVLTFLGEVGPEVCALIPLIWALIVVTVTRACPGY